MTVGTSTVLNDSRYDIISDALMLLGVNEAGENIADADMQLGVRWLNRLVKQWEAKGIYMNTDEYATLFLEYGINEYIIGNGSAVHWASEPITQTLTLDAAVSTTTLNIETSVGLTIGDHIGIVDNEGAIQWTTIATIPTPTSVTINAALLDASNAENLVYSYTDRPASGAPLKIIDANVLNNAGEQTSSIIMPILAFEDFFQLTNKFQLGSPINLSYDKKIDTGIVRIWLTPNNCATRIRLHYQRPMFDFTSAITTQDMPPQYLSSLIYNLAVLLAPSYGKSSLLPTLVPIAQQMLDEVENFDQENVSIYFNPVKYRY